jgi:hypothetical protein
VRAQSAGDGGRFVREVLRRGFDAALRGMIRSLHW